VSFPYVPCNKKIKTFNYIWVIYILSGAIFSSAHTCSDFISLDFIHHQTFNIVDDGQSPKKDIHFTCYTVSYMVEKVRERSLQALHYKLHSWQSLKEEVHFRYYTIDSWWTKSKEWRSLLVLHCKLHSGQKVKKEGHFRYYTIGYMVDKDSFRCYTISYTVDKVWRKKVISGTTLKITWWTKSTDRISLQ
jgi:hypothetical protein